MYPENNYDPSEATMLDGSTNEVSNESVATQSNVIEEGSGWKKVAMGAGAGILLGSVATLLTGSTIAKPTEEVEAAAEENAEEDASEEAHPAYVDETISVASAVSDDMSFSEAFAAARAEVGTAGAFEWHGNVYSTFTANEWDNMTAQEHTEYGSHFNWAAHEGTSSSYAHNAHHSNDAEAPSHETAQTDANVHTPADIPDSDVSVVEPSATYVPEVEVLGVVHDMETGVNVGGLTIDGQEVLVVDYDGDKTFDIVVSDLNHDGEIQDDEVADISQRGLSVEDLGGVTNYVDDMFAGVDDEPMDDGLYEV